MKLTLITAILIFIASLATTQAQESRLKGKVVRAESRGSATEIRITVKDRGTGKTIQGEQSSTEAEDWFHVAPVNALVDVEFDGGICYVLDGQSQIRVRQVNEDLQKVTLQMTRDCKIREKLKHRAKGSIATARAREEVGSIRDRAGAATPISETAQAKTSKMEEYMEAASVADLMPSPEQLKQELEAEAKHARNGGFFDTFQYKFALKVELYGKSPALNNILVGFQNNRLNQDLFRALGKTNPQMFSDVVRRELQTSQQVNLENILAIVKEDSVSREIRGSATVALLNAPLPDEIRTQAIAYYRQETVESPIFTTSLIALGRIGDTQDEIKVYKYVTDGSGDTRRSAMEAMYLTKLVEGPEVFPDGAKRLATVATSSEDPKVRAYAYHSLRPFVYQGDQDAFKALFEGSQDRDPLVRTQVVLAFGVGKTEQNPKVRNLLRTILINDPSPQVREAARLSLSGYKTTYSAIDKMGWN